MYCLLLPFPNPTTCPFLNLRSINLIWSPSPLSLSISSFFLCLGFLQATMAFRQRKSLKNIPNKQLAQRYGIENLVLLPAITELWQSPHDIDLIFKLLNCWITDGSFTSKTRVPCPSWPLLPSPNEYTLPSWVRANVWPEPQATAVKWPPSVATGCGRDVFSACFSFRPNFPFSFSPNVNNFPLSRKKSEKAVKRYPKITMAISITFATINVTTYYSFPFHPLHRLGIFHFIFISPCFRRVPYPYSWLSRGLPLKI